MLTQWMFLVLAGCGVMLITAVPWVVVYESWKGRNDNEQPDPVGVIVCGVLCLFEISALVDWASGTLIGG